MSWKVLTIVTALLMLLAASLTLPKEARAWERDSHYDLKLTLVMRMGCFTWQEAHEIASADLAVDTKKSTKAGLGKSNNKDWHAFGTDQEYAARAAQLRQRVIDEPNAIKKRAKFGQYLHFVEDRSAHAGYGWFFGHGWNTFWSMDADSLNTDPAKSHQMILDTLNELAWFGVHLGRAPNAVNGIWNEAAFQAMIDALIANSNPGWWWWGKDGIINRNKAILGAYLDAYLDGLSDRKGAPDPAVIPPPLDVEYDDTGEPIKVGDEEFVFVDPRKYQSELVFVSARAIPVSQYVWNLEFEVKNEGTLSSLEGPLNVWSLNGSQGIVDQEITTIASINAGATLTIPVSSVSVAEEPFLTVEAWVDDADASNNDLLYPQPGVGGIAELPDVASDSGSSTGTYAALASGLTAAVLALGAAGWYARRRWSR